MNLEPLIFELSSPGRRAYYITDDELADLPVDESIPRDDLRDTPPDLPEVSEVAVVRHFTRLSRLNYGVDIGFYPLGSCTMKYNPKINEVVSRFPGLTQIHPYQPVSSVQGALEILYEIEHYLCEIGGMDRVTLQPAAGAHGELTGLLLIKAYHRSKGQNKTKVIVPDSAHGTNPASASMAGMQVVQVKSDSRGQVDIDDLKRICDHDVAALMLTNPNTLGLFEENIVEIANIVHGYGGLLYYDGANANAILGITRPGDMGFDVVHFNLHKTFSTPHGGGGPGSGPVGVKQELVPFLPVPVIEYDGSAYSLDYDRPLSIGKMKSFYGNFGVIVKAYTYIISLGTDGLRRVSENAVLNANYLLKSLQGVYEVPFGEGCMHEFVITPEKIKDKAGIRTLDIAKRLPDYGIHAPTVYFPMIVDEALMIEPTETESIETLNEFRDAMLAIAAEAENDPETVKSAPHTTPVGRLDEVLAARKPDLRWRKDG